MNAESWAILDLETRCNLSLAREVLHLDGAVDPVEVSQRLVEQRHAEGHGTFLKLPFHEPVAGSVLLAERRGCSPDGPIVATGWLCWQAGESSLERFIARFFEAIAGRVVVGFNSTGFDLPLMELWASRLLVPAPAYFNAPSARCEASLHCDLQREIAGRAGGAGNFDLLCKFHGLPGKPGLSGKDVESLVAQGRLDEVLAYNVTDVMQSYLLLLHVLTRAGRLTLNAATASARASIAMTRTEITPKLPSASRALGLLQTSLRDCERAPIASER